MSRATTAGQSGPEKDDNEWVHCIIQSSNITKTSSSDFSVTSRTFLGEFYSSAEM